MLISGIRLERMPNIHHAICWVNYKWMRVVIGFYRLLSPAKWLKSNEKRKLLFLYIISVHFVFVYVFHFQFTAYESKITLSFHIPFGNSPGPCVIVCERGRRSIEKRKSCVCRSIIRCDSICCLAAWAKTSEWRKGGGPPKWLAINLLNGSTFDADNRASLYSNDVFRFCRFSE